jgi:aerobic carbon-monoxide dehydrogenase large subunit
MRGAEEKAARARTSSGPEAAMSEPTYGVSLPRREDGRLLLGKGRFTADLQPDGLHHAVFVRSPHGHARIARIDTAAASASPGVIAVLTAADLATDGIGPLISTVELKRPDGTPAPSTPRPLLVSDVVRHLGEPVAVVIAASRMDALDAGELVEVEYEPLPAVTTCREAMAPGAPAVWANVPDNIAFLWRHGDRVAVDTAIASAAHVTRLDYGVSRVAANPLEPRVTLAQPSDDGRIIVHSSTQNPFQLRDALARQFNEPLDRIRVVAGDVGGSFGMKAGLFREDALVYWATRRLRKPVRWVADRSEAFLSDDQARDVQFAAALALNAAGEFLALQVRYNINIGGYLSGRSLNAIINIGGIAGVYRTPAIAADVYGVLTNTIPTSPYRGAGRPDATFVIERLIDVAAAELGIDPMALRRRNLIPAAAMPFKTAFLFEYDCGDFAANMEMAAKRADLAGLPARKADAAKRGKLRGLGICNPVEAAGGPYGHPQPDRARLLVREDGTAHLFSGAMSVGQGLETALAQMVAAKLGVPIDKLVYHQGDTDELSAGRGSGGSSGLCVSGAAVSLAVDETIEAGRKLAADHLEVAVADVEFVAGAFTVAGTDRAVSLADIAKRAAAAAPDQGGLSAGAVFQPPSVTFPNGCHVCEVEVDPETGTVEVVSYVAVEDIGRVLNPLLAHGQIHGGVAQGMGQALFERIVYESESAQLLTGSFMDYAMPRASDIPAITIEMREVPTKVNVLGVKGVGEAGTIGALSATINAICDALAPLGVRHLDMPASPDRVWAAIQAASQTTRRVP